ncbi:MAG: hypothetical protein AAFN77_11355 [Planctomycetota bacterium]
MSRLIVICFAAALLVCSGCWGDGLVSLEGQVTIDGEPAYEGIGLQFQPLGGGSPSYAKTDADGRYVAEFTHRKQGIMVGKHRVSLVPGGGGGEPIPEMDENGKVSAPKGAKKRKGLPAKYYGEIMEITIENTSNKIDIPLVSAKANEAAPTKD